LNKLKGLGLYHNGLQTLPDSITNLKKLEQVDVQGNALSDLSEAACQFLDGVGSKPT
jgi:Leucine-rich repeat (LRR) protein